jgi:hypothetical protein
VFARDPDALLDLTELEITDGLRRQQEDKAACKVIYEWLCRFNKQDTVSEDDRFSAAAPRDTAQRELPEQSFKLMMQETEKVKATVRARTAWRIEGTFREFPKQAPLNLWFDYPIHRADEDEVLKDAAYEGDGSDKNQKMLRGRKNQVKEQKTQSISEFDIAFENIQVDGVASAIDIAKELGKTPDRIKTIFGNGEKADEEYKKYYEKIRGQDGKAYIKRKGTDTE